MDARPILHEQDRPKAFYRWRMLIVGFGIMSEMLVFFQRGCATIVADPMSKDYNVDVAKLSLFSSVYFYIFGFLQPFTGILADILEPGYLIGGGTLISSIGTLITGISKTLFVGCIGRVFVGIGCSAIYICCIRFIANWYDLKSFARSAGLFISVSAIGGVIANFPLAMYADIVGWRWSFYTIAIIGSITGFLDLFIIRGSPTAKGFEKVNAEEADPVHDYKEKFKQLKSNVKSIVTVPSFWFCAFWAFLINGSYLSVNGMWGAPYLMDVMGYSSQNAGVCLMGLSFSIIVLSYIIPLISDLLKTKKWTIFVLSLAGILVILPLAFFPKKLSTPIFMFLFFCYAMTTTSVATIVYPLVREYSNVSASATSIAFANSASFIGSSILQIVSGVIVKKFGTQENGKYTEEGYRYGVWILNASAQLIGAFLILFAKDSVYATPDNTMLQSADYESIQDLIEQEKLV